MKRNIWIGTVVVSLVLFLIAGFSSAVMAFESSTPKVVADKGKVVAGETTLKVVAGKGNLAKIELINEKPVRGVQFTISGVKVTEIRTTSRAKGFLSKFNEKNGKAILVSTSGETIAPGKGQIAEIVCDKPGAASLSDIVIAEIAGE